MERSETPPSEVDDHTEKENSSRSQAMDTRPYHPRLNLNRQVFVEVVITNYITVTVTGLLAGRGQ